MTERDSSTSEYYFAYGSNMSAKYLKNVRKVSAVDSQRAVLENYRLIFNLRGPNFLEPGFANIAEYPDESIEGVLYKVSPSDLEKILGSEPDEYKIETVLVQGASGSIEAKTLIYVGGGSTEYQPSRRYLNLLLKAGKNYQLSNDYIAKLKSTETVYYPVLSELFGSVIYAYIMLNSK
ncbi:MAG: gamma-glutamylcyclotransferase [Gammaproteobacteria bacterium]|nr:gamma-glutamylcyclotransferase [Gammaproteobacteria bacterium]